MYDGLGVVDVIDQLTGVLHHLQVALPHLARLAGISRIAVTSCVDRKTFFTFKIRQGMPSTEVMVATGHQTEKSFMRYLGTSEQELVESYRRVAKLAA